jgi:hydrogenase maturation protease
MSWSEAEKHVLIIGIGNPMRGDDGVGPAVAERLEQVLASEPVRVMACQQLLPEMADELSRVELAVFIDASCELLPGQIQCLPVEAILDVPQASTHNFDPPGLLRLSKQIYGRSPRAMVVAIGAESFEFEEKLSPTVMKVFDAVVERVRQMAIAQSVGKDAGNA